MRTSTSIAAILLLACAAPRAAELSDTDRQRLVAHMEMTSAWLIDEVTGLSQAQLTFRPAEGRWSVLEVLEHLVVVGPIYWDDLQEAVKGPPLDRDLSAGDANVLWYGIDRTFREQAIPGELAKGQLRDVRAGLEKYRKQHAQLLEYVKTTKDDLRRRYVPRQRCDAYQWALLISTHEQRHILQIREIKKDPKFPAR